MPDYRLATRRAARKYNVDPRILEALVKQESGFREGVKSPAGAQDIAQFMPATAKAYGVTLGDGRVTDDLEGAAKYIADNLKKTGGNYHEALSIYNSGRADAYKDPGFAGGQTYNYVRSILADAKREPGSSGDRGASPSAGSTSRTTTTTSTPGVDNSGARAALIAQFLGSRDNSASGNLAFAQQAAALKDTPATTRTVKSSAGKLNAAASGSTSVGTDRSLKTTFGGVTQSVRVGDLPKVANAQDVKNLKGLVDFDGKPVAAWVGYVLNYARKHGWKGGLSEGYRTDAQQTGIYKSGVRPAAVPRSLGGGGSNHEVETFPGGAADVLDAAGLAAVLARSPYRSLLQWAGSKDPPHFSHPHGGSY